jgi:hypothetical protein
MIEGIKDEQVNLKKQNMKLSVVLEAIKNKIGNINGQVGMMLTLSNNKIDQNFNQINSRFHAVNVMDRKFGGIFDKLVSLEKGVSDVNIKIEEIKRNDDFKTNKMIIRKEKVKRKIVLTMMLIEVQITLTLELMTLMIV